MKKFTYIVFFCFIFVLIYLIFFISSTTADTITVGPEGSPTYDYAAINTAISNANESDTIYVYPGTYTENIVINKKINLIGISGSDSTTIVTSSATKNTIEVTNNYVNISGFTIKNLGGSFACIKLHYATNCIINNIIIQNGGNGLFLVYSDNNIIRTCTIKSNNVGIYLSYSSNNMIYSNNIQYNNANGIFVSAGCLGNTFYLNDFLDNSDGNARDSGSNNWDYNQEGNYWDDYNDYDNNSDGIGDNSYSISGSGGNKDNYPLGDFLNTNNKPIAYIDSISPNPAIKGNVVSFTGHGTDDDTITNWEWKSSIDGILSFSKNYKTSSLSTGAHIISYRVQDNDGYWSNYVYESLVITAGNQKPYAYILEPITSITKEYGENITFLGDWSDEGYVVEYFWRSSIDGFLNNSIQFTRNNLSVGQHIIYFKVKDNNNEWSQESSIDVIILSEKINNPPVAIAGGPYTGIVNQSIIFDASDSYDPDEGDNITSYIWDFGDGTAGEGIYPQHIYTTKGNYTVELTVNDNNGEQNTVTTYVNISTQKSNQNNKTFGFEIMFFIIALLLVIFFIRKKRN